MDLILKHGGKHPKYVNITHKIDLSTLYSDTEIGGIRIRNANAVCIGYLFFRGSFQLSFQSFYDPGLSRYNTIFIFF